MPKFEEQGEAALMLEQVLLDTMATSSMLPEEVDLDPILARCRAVWDLVTNDIRVGCAQSRLRLGMMDTAVNLVKAAPNSQPRSIPATTKMTLGTLVLDYLVAQLLNPPDEEELPVP